MKMKRSVFGKIAKYMFIFFNITMFIALIFLVLSIDEFICFLKYHIKMPRNSPSLC